MSATTIQATGKSHRLADEQFGQERGAGPGHWLLAPHSLLLASGTLLGMKLPIGKLASDAGVSALLWAGIVSLGVVVMLLPTQLTRRGLQLPGIAVLRYTAVSAVISFIVPNLLLFTVIPEVGAGYTGLMFALSPVFTLLIAAVLGMRTPGRLGLAGIAMGVVGAVLVSLTRGAAPQGPEPGWLAAAAAIPIALASGNVYRSRHWPPGAEPNALAFWGHAVATGVFLVIILATQRTIPLAEVSASKGLVTVQMLLSGLNFPLFYRLQRNGGPVLLSQIGYVAAAVSLITATVFLGERYSATTWLGAAIIGAGIFATVTAQRLEARLLFLEEKGEKA
ncbi:MAG: DMT family transporter [Halieaceae bacterium]|nr:DMT family transporter [Halieaceae bacterium]